MSSDRPAKDEPLPLHVTRQIDALCDEFELLLNGDELPPFSTFVERVEHAGRRRLLEELAALSMERLRRRGALEPAVLLLEANPELAEELEELLEHEATILVQELDNEYRAGRGLHVRCPHCRNPIELVPDAELESIQCPSCGSNFSLVGDRAATKVAEPVSEVGHFKLIERVGVGAFGSVWKAHDTQLDRTVAVKIPRKGQFDEKQEKAFLREAQNAAQLSHPAIVPVYEVGRDGDTLYIVSDFVRGLTLADWLTGPQPTSREAAELCVQIAEAMHHAHERGVIHRDLKPGNIMLDGDVQPHLMDFGLAKREAGEITMSLDGQVLGTPAYMSPEQAQGDVHTADRRSDIYSLGVILFQLLTGELPFRGNARMLLHQVIHDDPPSPRKLNAHVPRDLETVTLKCLAKEPERRYQTAAELQKEFQRFLLGEPIRARPISQGERAWRWARRNPVVAGLLGTVALVLFVGIAVSTWQAVRATSAERATELQNYYRTIALAELRIKNGEFQGVDEMLMATKPEYRNWEWQYLKDQLSVEDARVVADHDGIDAFVESPNGKWAATAGRDRSVALWDAVTLEEVHRWSPISQSGITSLAFSPDSTYLAVGTGYAEVFTCSLPKGEPIARFRKQNHGLRQVLFNPDGKTLYLTTSSGKDRFHLIAYDTETWKQLGMVTVEGGEVVHAVSPDGKLTASVGYYTDLIVRDADTLEPVWVRPLEFHQYSVAFDKSSARVLTGGWGGGFYVWSINQDGPALTVKSWASNETGFVRVHPKNKYYLTANREGATLLVDPNTGREMGRFINGEPLVDVAFSHDGNSIFTASQGGTLKRWRLAHLMSYKSTKTTPEKFVFGGAVGLRHHTNEGAYGFGLAYSEDGKYLAACGTPNGQVTVWNANTLERLRVLTLDGATNDWEVVEWFLAFHPRTNELVVPRRQSIQFFDIESGRMTKSFGTDGLPYSGVFDARGEKLVLGVVEQGVTVIDPDSGEKRHLEGSPPPQRYFVAITPDGKLIAACSNSSDSIYVWNIEDGSILHTFETNSHGNNGIALHAKRPVLAAAGADSQIRLYDISKGTLLRTLRGHIGIVKGLSFSPDGDRLLSAGHDQTARLWDWRTGQLVLTLDNANYFAHATAFRPDGKQIAVVDRDPSVWVRQLTE